MTAATTDEHRVSEARLTAFVRDVLARCGVGADDAATVAEVLVASDLRGIPSHGVARLGSHYVSRLRAGAIVPVPEITVLRETPTAIALDGGNGLGHPVARRAMETVIAKASERGAAFGTVRNSNHFGIAGWYAMLALPHGMIGIASTNTVRFAAPTYGREVLLGTNPFAYAIPAGEEPPFVLDFATTTVPRGAVEVRARGGRALEPGWAVDAEGRPTEDPAAALTGALLPLGGLGVDGGGHKGYGLGLLAELLTGVLAGGAFGRDLPLPGEPPRAGAVSHFFAAFRVDGFRDLDAFRRDMDRELRAFKTSRPAAGHDRVRVAGELEHERTIAHRRDGIPLAPAVVDDLARLAAEFGIDNLV